MKFPLTGKKFKFLCTFIQNFHVMEQFKIFIVEDDPWYGEILAYHLSLNPDHEISRFTTGKECLANLSKKPFLVSIDYSLPDMNGIELLQKIKEYNSSIP